MAACSSSSAAAAAARGLLPVVVVLLLVWTAQGNDSWLKVWTEDYCQGQTIIGCGCFDLDIFRSFEYGYGQDSKAKPLEYSNERGCQCSDPQQCAYYYYSMSSCSLLFNVTDRGSIKLSCEPSSAL